MSQEPRLIEGGLAVDDRGQVSFVNGFDFQGVKRFYIVANHREGFVRAWHGHRFEQKYIYCTSGAMVVGAVKVDDWDNPSADLPVRRFVLSAQKPAVLHIPAGYANGLMSLTPDAQLMIFSSSTVDESRNDDIRFPARHWNIWEVEER
jgi:dTDP-4-dehydrorhamnose 3,5-epimerase-like enzyme